MRERELEELEQDIEQAKKRKKKMNEATRTDNPEVAHQVKSPRQVVYTHQSEDKLMNDFYHGSPQEKHWMRSGGTKASQSPKAVLSHHNENETERNIQDAGNQLISSIFA